MSMKTTNGFSILVRAVKSHFEVDPRGKISIASAMLENKVYLFAATAEKNSILQVAAFDIPNTEILKITHLRTYEYTNSDFVDPYEKRPLSYDFNLREVVHLTKATKSTIGHHLILSCFNNGLIFFKLLTEDLQEDCSETSPILKLTYNFEITDIVNIYSEKAYRQVDDSFTFFTSRVSPPVGYEFKIDRDMNLNLYRVYESRVDIHRYEGRDVITSNAQYVAMLIYDNKYRTDVIRVFSRYETYFSIGHVDIPVKDFLHPVTSIVFLSYYQDLIFARNSEKWEVYRIKDSELVINTMDYRDQYQAWINRTYEIDIQACSQILCDRLLTQSFNITCLDEYDMSAYLVRKIDNKLSFAYNNNMFQFDISEHYLGPDLRFQVDQDLPFGAKIRDVIMPAIENPYFKRNITLEYEGVDG